MNARSIQFRTIFSSKPILTMFRIYFDPKLFAVMISVSGTSVFGLCGSGRTDLRTKTMFNLFAPGQIQKSNTNRVDTWSCLNIIETTKYHWGGLHIDNIIKAMLFESVLSRGSLETDLEGASVLKWVWWQEQRWHYANN